MTIRKVSEWEWEHMQEAPKGNIVITEKRDGWYMMATSADNLDNTIKAIMQALNDYGVKVFDDQLVKWWYELHAGMEDSFRWTESGIDDCLRGRWLKSWEIEYTDNNTWEIFLAVAK